MTPIDAVIFDLDDTLIDWSQQSESLDDIFRPHVDNMHAYLSAEGHALPCQDEFFQCYKHTIIRHWDRAKQDYSGVNFTNALCDCLTEVDVEVSAVDMNALLHAYDLKPLPGVEPFPDAHDVLDALRVRNYKIGLVTNSMLPMWMRDVELRHYQMIDYFDARITSGDSGTMKPHPDIYHRICDLLNTAPEQAVFVGDRPSHDIAGANGVGMVSVLMSPPHLNRELNGVQPDHIIGRLSELLPILDARAQTR